MNILNILKNLFSSSGANGESKTAMIIMRIIIIILICVGIFFIVRNSILKNDLNNEKLKSSIYKQNWKAYEDSTKMKAKIMQRYAIKIQDLNIENNKLNNRINVLQTKYTLFFDSVKVLNEYAQTHNFGDSIIVEFKGKRGKISYQGHTTYFVLKDTATYSLFLKQDSIKIVNNLFIDSSTGIIYSEIFADSILIDRAETKVDSALYAKLFLSNNKVQLALDFWDRLSFALETNQIWNIKEQKANITGEVGIQYKFPSNISIKVNRDFINSWWITGVKYEISPGYIFNSIF